MRTPVQILESVLPQSRTVPLQEPGSIHIFKKKVPAAGKVHSTSTSSVLVLAKPISNFLAVTKAGSGCWWLPLKSREEEKAEATAKHDDTQTQIATTQRKRSRHREMFPAGPLMRHQVAFTSVIRCCFYSVQASNCKLKLSNV